MLCHLAQTLGRGRKGPDLSCCIWACCLISSGLRTPSALQLATHDGNIACLQQCGSVFTMNLALRQEASCHSAFVCMKATPPRSRLVTAIIDDWISQQSNESIAKPKDKLQLLLGGLYLRRSPRVCLFRTPSNSIWGIFSSSAVFVSKWPPVTCLWMHPCTLRTPAASRSLGLCGPCPAGRIHYRFGSACAVFSPFMLG